MCSKTNIKSLKVQELGDFAKLSFQIWCIDKQLPFWKDEWARIQGKQYQEILWTNWVMWANRMQQGGFTKADEKHFNDTLFNGLWNYYFTRNMISKMEDQPSRSIMMQQLSNSKNLFVQQLRSTNKE